MKIPSYPRRYLPLFSKFPLWLLLICFLLVIGYWKYLSDDDLRVILLAVVKGLGVTLFVAFVGFICSTALGLLVGILRSSRIYLVSQIAGVYIEIVRGLPIVVVLYYIAFVMTPFLIGLINFIISPLISIGIVDAISVREFSFLFRAILALVCAYSAFIAEIFRAGVQAIDDGQIEAARSLGFSRFKMFFPLILPQAVRNVLPSLANELVAIVKDSSLVSVLGVADITQIGKVYSTSTFQYVETYNIVALMYLSLTITLSFGVRLFEKKLLKRKKGITTHI